MKRLWSTQTQKIGLLLLSALFVMFMSTFLHEGGHALVGLLAGGTITSFNVSFLDLGAHVDMTGALTPAQLIVNNLAGASMPLLVWLIFMSLVPKRANLVIETIKVISTIMFLSTLLAWIALPIGFLSGQAPAGDDVVNFLNNSGVYPLWVSVAALLALIGGGWLFAAKIDGLRSEINLFRNVDETAISPGTRQTALVVAGVLALCGLVAFGANGFRFTAPRSDPYLPPAGYQLVKTIDLAQGNLENVEVVSFKIEQPTRVGVYLLIEAIQSDFFDVHLNRADGFDRLLVHGEGYQALKDNPHLEETLPAGSYTIALTSRSKAGVLNIYTRGVP
jgi:hypothetical protein